MHFRFFDRAHYLSQGTVRFVTHRTVLSVALAAAGLALAVGITIGRWMAVHGNGGGHVERDYTIDQLGRLNAAQAQIESRMTQLTAQIGVLHDFEAHLHTSGVAGAW